MGKVPSEVILIKHLLSSLDHLQNLSTGVLVFCEILAFHHSRLPSTISVVTYCLTSFCFHGPIRFNNVLFYLQATLVILRKELEHILQDALASERLNFRVQANYEQRGVGCIRPCSSQHQGSLLGWIARSDKCWSSPGTPQLGSISENPPVTKRCCLSGHAYYRDVSTRRYIPRLRSRVVETGSRNPACLQPRELRF